MSFGEVPAVTPVTLEDIMEEIIGDIRVSLMMTIN